MRLTICISAPKYVLKKLKAYVYPKTGAWMFIAALFRIGKDAATQMSINWCVGK